MKKRRARNTAPFTLLTAAAHWDKIAAEAEELAAWNRKMGYDLSAPGKSAGDNQARIYRKCARILRHEHETGDPHCMCCEQPVSKCSYKKLKPTR